MGDLAFRSSAPGAPLVLQGVVLGAPRLAGAGVALAGVLAISLRGGSLCACTLSLASACFSVRTSVHFPACATSAHLSLRLL
eukprot:5083364-Pleurochrysis_carterae.AAC.2